MSATLVNLVDRFCGELNEYLEPDDAVDVLTALDVLASCGLTLVEDDHVAEAAMAYQSAIAKFAGLDGGPA